MKWDFKLKAKAFLASTGAALVLGLSLIHIYRQKNLAQLNDVLGKY